MLESGRFILGPNVEAFEHEAAAYLGAGEAVGVANGTDALVLVLEALGIGPGDEVVCPAFTFYATAEAIARRGATPVFCDVERETLNLDPVDVARRVTGRTRAIVAVHLFGRPAALERLPAGIPVVEDAAQAFGARLGVARAGALGAAGTFSFFPTKNLPALGDGGLVATSDAQLAERVRLLRLHGSRDKQTFEAVGYNSRLDELQAAVLRLLLARVDVWNDARREAAGRYAAARARASSASCPADDAGHVYHMYVVRTPGARPGGCGARGRGNRLRRLLPHAPPPPARVRVARLPGGRPAGDGAGRPGEPRAAAVRRNHRPISRNGSSHACARRYPSERPGEAPVPPPRLAGGRRRRARGRGLVPRVLAALRRGNPCPVRQAVRAEHLHRRPDQARRLRPVRLLQPLVAVRLDPGHVGTGSRRHRRHDRGRVRRLPGRPGGRLPGSPLRARPRLARPARARGRRPPARADDHRASRAPQPRRPRQGSARGRGRGRRTADHQGDAAQRELRVHADRRGRRRPAQEEPPPARHPGDRVHARAAAADRRREARRGDHRDSLRARGDAPADRHRLPRRGRPGQDAARRCTS